jgi:heat shock protein HslJ
MKKPLFIATIIIAGFSCSPKLSPDQNWGGQHWVLTEMKGVPVQLSGSRRDAFIEFSPSNKHFTGNGGCNRISGNYTLEKKDHLKLGEVISTKMSCADINFETTFLSVLNTINRFETDGNTLWLKDGGDRVLKFEPGQASR